MQPDIGEQIVGAYLKLKMNCNVIDYNVRVPGGGLEGLNEIDVVGLDFKKQTANLCEVTTHIRGTLYTDNKTTVERIKAKYEHLKKYAHQYLTLFPNHKYYFWAPYVPEGFITQGLNKIIGLELVINTEYSKRVNELRQLASETTHDTNNTFFRSLQILEHLR